MRSGAFGRTREETDRMLLRGFLQKWISMERRSFLSTHLSGAWLAEVRPFMSVSDPTMKGFTLEFPQQPAYSGVVNFTSAVPVDKPVTSAPLNVILVTQNHVYEGTATYIAGTRSTFVSGVSPLGYKLKAFPHRRLQPFVTGLGGFAVSPRDIPVFNSSAFNFTFEFGAGVEVFQTHTRSVQLEYRYHHLANAGNGAVPLTFTVGGVAGTQTLYLAVGN